MTISTDFNPLILKSEVYDVNILLLGVKTFCQKALILILLYMYGRLVASTGGIIYLQVTHTTNLRLQDLM